MDAGYDVADFYQEGPKYRPNKYLKHLFDAIHEKEKHILLDLVVSHTSTKHTWFKGRVKPDRNEYTDRYEWTDLIWGEPE